MLLLALVVLQEHRCGRRQHWRRGSRRGREGEGMLSGRGRLLRLALPHGEGKDRRPAPQLHLHRGRLALRIAITAAATAAVAILVVAAVGIDGPAQPRGEGRAGVVFFIRRLCGGNVWDVCSQ